MKLWATGAAALIVAAGYFVAPEIRLHVALRGTISPAPDHPSIIMLGDSHTDFVNWQILMGCDSIANYGVGGNTTTQILARLPDVLSQKPRLIIVMAGTNDALRYVPPEETVSNLKLIQQQITDHGIEYISLTPPPLLSLGTLVSASVAAISIPFTEDDLLDDKIHLRRSGYIKWRDAIAPIVRRFC